MQRVAHHARLVAAVHDRTGFEHFAHPDQQPLLSEYLRRLRRAVPDLPAHGDLARVHIQSQLDDHSRLDESTFLRFVFSVMFHQPTGWPLLDRLSASCYLEPTLTVCPFPFMTAALETPSSLWVSVAHL